MTEDFLDQYEMKRRHTWCVNEIVKAKEIVADTTDESDRRYQKLRMDTLVLQRDMYLIGLTLLRSLEQK